MGDLIKRLRTEDTKEHHGRRLICGCAPLRHEAADEIERLKALEEAIERALDVPSDYGEEISEVRDILEEAIS